MTMYITVASTARVVQASDRRITNYLAGKPRSQMDRNKAIVVNCFSGSFTLAFAGIATIGGKPTDELIAALFSELSRDRLSIKPLFVRLADVLSRRFLYVRPPKNLSISAAGYFHNGALFWARIANHEDHRGAYGPVQEKFSVYGRIIASPTRKETRKSTYVEIGGIADNQSRKLIDGTIKELRRSRFFHRVSGETVANKLVEIIQKFAQSPAAQNLVGTNCITTIINAPPATEHSFKYHSLGNEPISYGPYFVLDETTRKGFADGTVIEWQSPI